MTFKLGDASKRNAKGVDDDIMRIAVRALEISTFDATVLATGGMRTAEDQKAIVARGFSWTLKSRHMLGMALDLVALTPGKGVDWNNLEAFKEVARAVKQAAAELKIPIRQGCDWNLNGRWGESKEYDWAHFEKPKEVYLQRAVKLMNQHRRELGLDDESSGPSLPCPSCGVSLALKELES